MCSTLSTSIAYWITDRQLRSVCTTTLATLRWTKTSPGAMSMIWLAGTRESEHPIQRYFGCWIFDSRAKKPGSSASTRSDQMRLRSRRSCIRCIGVPCIAKEGPRSGRDADVARLGEEAHGLQPALAAEAGLAHAAEGRPQVAHQ